MLRDMLNAVERMRDILDEMDNIAMVQSVIGTAFDEWCVEHGMTSKETCEALQDLAEVQLQIHQIMGSADYAIK